MPSLIELFYALIEEESRPQKHMRKQEITVAELRKVFGYDPLTGVITWLPREDALGRMNIARMNKPAGTLHGDGGIQINLDGLFYQANRIAWALHYGEWPKGVVDHDDRNRSNNRIVNLRDSTMSNNNCNRQTVGKTSGFKGVYYIKKHSVFGAQIKINRKSEWLGCFNTAKDAALAYDKRALELFGEYALTNKMMGLL